MSQSAGWAPGWFPDPTGRHDHRWWDGVAWTAHVADAGVASLDELPSSGELPSRSRPRTAVTATSSKDPVAVTALAVAIGSVLLALVPGFGLILPAAAIVLALVARSRLRCSGQGGDGTAIAGLVIGIGSLLLALVITAFSAVLLLDSGGELAGVFAEYVACLEVSSPSECRVLLEESLARISR